MVDADVPNDEILRKGFDDYEMLPHEKQTLKEIRKKIEKNEYKELAEIEQHQEMLEDMTNKLRVIMQNERSMGASNWVLERYAAEVQELYFMLEKLRKEKERK
jgi:hypothetical protein